MSRTRNRAATEYPLHVDARRGALFERKRVTLVCGHEGKKGGGRGALAGQELWRDNSVYGMPTLRAHSKVAGDKVVSRSNLNSQHEAWDNITSNSLSRSVGIFYFILRAAIFLLPKTVRAIYVSDKFYELISW